MACVILTLLVAPWPVLLGALIVATALTGVSGAQYIARGYRQVHA
jgi:hypothetical protein